MERKVQESKCQNWDKAKPKRGHFLCQLGCGQHVPNSEKIIHEQYCPAKRLSRAIQKKIREMPETSNSTTESSEPGLEDWDLQLEGKDQKQAEKQKRAYKRGKKFFLEMKRMEEVDLIDLRKSYYKKQSASDPQQENSK